MTTSETPETPIASAMLEPVTAAPTPLKTMIDLSNKSEVWDFANEAAQTKMVPDLYQGDARTILVVAQWCTEIGIPLMQGLQNIALINGRPSMWGDLGKALVLSAPDLVSMNTEWDEDTRSAKVTIVRRTKNGGEVTGVGEFSWADAEQAKQYNRKSGKWEPLSKKNTYQSYPRRMIQWRAWWYAARDTYSDRFRGLYGAEESMDHTPEEIKPAEVSVVEQPKAPAPKATDALKADLLGEDTLRNQDGDPIGGDEEVPGADPTSETSTPAQEPDELSAAPAPGEDDPLKEQVNAVLQNVYVDSDSYPQLKELVDAQLWLLTDVVHAFGKDWPDLDEKTKKEVLTALKAEKRVAHIGLRTKDDVAKEIQRLAFDCELMTNDLIELAHEVDVDYAGGVIDKLSRDDLLKILDALRRHRDVMEST